jgi:hypothetical protein
LLRFVELSHVSSINYTRGISNSCANRYYYRILLYLIDNKNNLSFDAMVTSVVKT